MFSTSHLHFMSSQTVTARIFVFCIVKVFRLFFKKRIAIALDNFRRSTLRESINEESKTEQQIINESLDHLGLTVYGSLLRILNPSNEINQGLIDQPLDYLKSKGIKLKTKVDLEALIAEKRGLIFVSAHLGAWEELILLGNLMQRPMFLLSKRMKIGWLQKLWDVSRKHSAQRLDEGFRAKTIVESLRKGALLADVLDQHCPDKKALKCIFMGRLAATSTDLTRFALLGNALIVPVFLVRTSSEQGGGYHLHIFDVIDPNLYLNQGLPHAEVLFKVTQKCCEQIEKAIELSPEQWLWIHRRWKVDVSTSI
jgi:lauroyl/myristoyl acyltransferase